MKEFFKINGKSIVMLYINQFVMSIFGLMVIGAAGSQDGNLLLILASILAIGLYLFIIYSMMWEAGAKAAAKTLRAEDAGVKKIKTPLLIVLFGSLFNIICYIIYSVLKIYVLVQNITSIENKAAAWGNLIELIIKMTNAIYMGFNTLLYPNPNFELYTAGEKTGTVIMLTPPYYFFLTLIPLFAVGILAYYLGGSEISIMRKLGFKPKHKPTVRKK